MDVKQSIFSTGIHDRFKDRITEEGLTAPDEIIPDGMIHRFSTDGSKTDDSGWYLFFADHIPVGIFGCWRTGIKVKWLSRSEYKLTNKEKVYLDKKFEEADLERKKREEEKYHSAEMKAQGIWDQAKKESGEHSYLLKKRIRPHNSKVYKGQLVIPVSDKNKKITSLQFISPEGAKKFLNGGRVKGCYCSLGTEPSKILFIAEGYATGATIQEHTSEAVTVAFNAGNLDSVCRVMREKFPLVEIIVCSDDDFETKSNPGMTKAIEASKNNQAKLVIPKFPSDRKSGETDFNDLFLKHGGELLEQSLSEIHDPYDLEVKLASKKVEQAILKAEAGDSETIFKKETLASWRIIQNKDKQTYQLKKEALKKVNKTLVSDLDSELKGKKKSFKVDAVDQLLQIAEVYCDLFHDKSGDTFASFVVKGHKEHWRLDSQYFRKWISFQYQNQTHRAPSETALKQALLTLGGKALIEAVEEDVHLRFAFSQGNYWIDLCDQNWKAVKINQDGWELVDDPPVKFIRTPQMRSLPEPPEEGDITPLWDIVNIPDESRLLVLAWMIECYRSNTPFPLLEITGEQGSAKSKTQYILRELIDPNEVNLRTNPSKTEFLFIESKNSHLVSYENLSQLKPEFQDALCTLATGGGSSVRKLYTNHEESVIHAKNPVILNGIDNLVTAQDLLDRTLTLELKRIRKRKTEEELQTQIEKSRPTIFTGILHLMVDALMLVPEIKISSLKIPRMADFAILGEAIYQVSGKEEGEFLKDYRDNRRRAIIRTIESSPAILQTIRHVEGLNGKAFYGSYAQLLREIESYNYPDLAWPKSPKGLGSLLKRFAPSIRQLGFNVEFDQKRSMDGYKVSISQFDSECAENITDEIEEEDTIPFE